jgi:hypothetical protein
MTANCKAASRLHAQQAEDGEQPGVAGVWSGHAGIGIPIVVGGGERITGGGSSARRASRSE